MGANDDELIFENTPLENLKTMLSEADATAQAAPGRESATIRPGRGVSKEEIKKVVQQLSEEPQQFLSAQTVNRIVSVLISGSSAPEPGLRNVLENKHVQDLEQLIKNRL